ncbi:hypothetical protein BaRGS_00038353 [Batillaria attramentaria]|uniref:DALR anticodon binding domain-containing protein n=1 Tax=Batillaria attramentaria TaxID=370345 RepID=A0ABD0J7J3_9CAEN
MAAEVEEKLCVLLKAALTEHNVDTKHVKVCRKVKDVKCGDYVVPRGALDIDIDAEGLKSLHLQEKFQLETTEDTLPVATVTQDKYNSVVFHIDRKTAFRNIIHQVLSEGDEYGSVAQTGPRAILNVVDLSTHNSSSQDGSSVSLTQLRAVVLMKHVLQLLTSNGYRAEVANSPVSDGVRDLLEALGVERDRSASLDLQQASKDILTSAKASEWKETQTARAESAAGDGSDSKSRDCLVVNVRRFAEAKGLPVGKNGFDKNLHFVDVIQDDGAVSDVVMEAAFLHHLQMENEKSASQSDGVSQLSPWCIHLVSQSAAFRQQQAHLLCQMCSPSQAHWKQRHLVFGTVGRRKSSTASVIDAKEFFNMRHSQMTQAAMMKYGDHDQGPGWEDMISGLTAASITFDILGTASPSQLQLDLSDGEMEGVDNRSGPFVMYNCARLATLISTFEDGVRQALYPELPDPRELDFTLLREEEEWMLAFLYLNTFPKLVREAFGTWQKDDRIAADFHTHKVAHFLLNFAKVLSSYYSRYHVLGGSEPHLLPLMFARLSLMKAAHQVLCNGLRLLGLQPFSQL